MVKIMDSLLYSSGFSGKLTGICNSSKKIYLSYSETKENLEKKKSIFMRNQEVAAVLQRQIYLHFARCLNMFYLPVISNGN